uniref:Uncharacterized protein n=1 Tax=Anguilla anguilla TaxID=7936 RepID=A0A0E9TH24_ANGAN
MHSYSQMARVRDHLLPTLKHFFPSNSTFEQ